MKMTNEVLRLSQSGPKMRLLKKIVDRLNAEESALSKLWGSPKLTLDHDLIDLPTDDMKMQVSVAILGTSWNEEHTKSQVYPVIIGRPVVLDRDSGQIRYAYECVASNILEKLAKPTLRSLLFQAMPGWEEGKKDAHIDVQPNPDAQ